MILTTNHPGMIHMTIPNIPRVVLFFSLSYLLLAQVTLADTVSEKLWEDTLSMVRKDFPRVQHISTDELAAILEEQGDFTLLDTREPEEYEVSYIQGAFLAEGVRDALKVLKDKSREDLVIVYCSVGYRSSNIAKKLARLGFTNVVNVEGSLFKWANENRPVFSGDKAVDKVHPYDEDWGRLLDRKYWQ